MHVEKSLKTIEKHHKFRLRLLEPVDFSINLLSIIMSGAKAARHDTREVFNGHLHKGNMDFGLL